MNYQTDFDAFYEKIVLGDEQNERINRAKDRLTKYLTDKYGLSDGAVFLQGSYPNGTAVKPDPEREGGEYDVDLVAVCAAPAATEDEAIQDLEDVLVEDADYAKRIERGDPKKPCIRLRYEEDDIGKFHVDATPARPSASAPLEIPRRGEGWHDTAPAEYTQWCRDQGEDFARLVQMLKRWRDHNQDAREAIKSIVLQVLVANHRVENGEDGDAVSETLRAIDAWLAQSPNSPPELQNPVPELDENLTERWQDDDYRAFREALSRAVALAEEARDEDDQNESRRKWRELFGNDFPPPENRGKYSPPGPPGTGRKSPVEEPRDVEWG